jgi:hypothetical protein
MIGWNLKKHLIAYLNTKAVYYPKQQEHGNG